MKYLRLVLNDEKMLEFMSSGDRRALVTERCAADGVAQGGAHPFVPEMLQPVRAARTARQRKCSVLITDGPYVETKEQLGCFSLTGTRNLKKAMRAS